MSLSLSFIADICAGVFAACRSPPKITVQPLSLFLADERCVVVSGGGGGGGGGVCVVSRRTHDGLLLGLGLLCLLGGLSLRLRLSWVLGGSCLSWLG